MSLESSIYTFLSSVPEITEIVGSSIWRNHRQGDELPCLVYFSPTSKPVIDIRKGTGTETITIQIDCFSLDDETNIQLVSLLTSSLDGFAGVMDGSQISNVKLRGVHDTSMPPTDSDSVWLYKRTADFTFKIKKI